MGDEKVTFDEEDLLLYDLIYKEIFQKYSALVLAKPDDYYSLMMTHGDWAIIIIHKHSSDEHEKWKIIQSITTLDLTEQREHKSPFFGKQGSTCGK